MALASTSRVSVSMAPCGTISLILSCVCFATQLLISWRGPLGLFLKRPGCQRRAGCLAQLVVPVHGKRRVIRSQLALVIERSRRGWIAGQLGLDKLGLSRFGVRRLGGWLRGVLHGLGRRRAASRQGQQGG